MPGKTPLDNVTIVLVDTRTPANIGAIARCMMNMGIGRLVLVNPPEDPERDAEKLAAGADDILRNAVSVSSLAEAVAEHNLVIGASRHAGRLRRNVRAPRAMAEATAPLLAGNKVALVFGNEVNGLDRNDLALCHESVSIPSSEAFPSLNLSHAVMIICYELYLAVTAGTAPTGRELARSGELEGFYRHLQSTLLTLGFLDRAHPERMMLVLRQLFNRAQLDEREVRILRGVLSSIGRSTNGNS